MAAKAARALASRRRLSKFLTGDVLRRSGHRGRLSTLPMKGGDPMLAHAVCTRCGYLTILKITMRGTLARKECTWCGRAFFLPWGEEERAAHAAGERRFWELAERHPELQRLRAPGDHVPPPEDARR